MGNLRKKAQSKLTARQNRYEELVKKFGTKWQAANKKPGSLKFK